ncbi:MAG: PLD nuclease N-terminal domain-containing protein [Defluviitaleaceae bacterium]|nr:PLD nuclease N-terminal domain-containing protein [Defluviitaleaceae bacterium]
MGFDLTPYLPLIIPLGVIQLGLSLAALIHILTHKSYKTGTRGLWIAVALLVSTAGPVIYFVFGRKEGDGDE